LLAVRDEQGGFGMDVVPLLTPLHRLSVPVRDTLRYIVRFHDQPLTLKRLSAVADLSLSHYSHQFQRETGMPPMQYLTLYRIEKAKRILQTSRHPIQQIARMVGVSNFYNFSRLFHRYAGMSPMDYRAKRQAVSDSRIKMRR
jgi:AraC-like DNA-binding protein